MADFGKLGRALTLATAVTASPALAEEPPSEAYRLAAMTTGEVTDCLGFVREQRDLARENNIVMSRRDQITLLDQCETGVLQERIAQQEQILAALDEQIQSLNLHLDEQARILDENNQVIAFIVAINGQWVIQRQLETDTAGLNADTDRLNADTDRLNADTDRLNADTDRLNADTERMLQEAERILQSLATS